MSNRIQTGRECSLVTLPGLRANKVAGPHASSNRKQLNTIRACFLFYGRLLVVFLGTLPLANAGNLTLNDDEIYNQESRVDTVKERERRETLPLDDGRVDLEAGKAALQEKRYEEAGRLFASALQHAQSIPDTVLLFQTFMEWGKIPYYKGNYSGAVKLWKKGLGVVNGKGLSKGAEGHIRSNLGAAYIGLQYFQSAFKNLRRAYEVLKNDPDATDFQRGIIRVNMAVALQNMEAYDYAYQILKDVEQVARSPYLKALVYVNLLTIATEKKGKKEFYRYLDSLNVYRSEQLTDNTLQILAEGGIAFSDWELVEAQLSQLAAHAAADPEVRYIYALPEFETFLVEQGRLLLDTLVLNQCIDRNRDYRTPRQLYELLHLKSTIVARQGDTDSALRLLKEADDAEAVWQDSLRSEQFADFAEQYRSESLKEEVTTLSSELDTVSDELRNNRLLNLLLLILLLSSLIVVYLFFRNLRKARALAQKEQELRVKSKQIAAQKMQLLEEELVENETKLHFTLTQQLHIQQLLDEAIASAKEDDDKSQGRLLNRLQMEQERLKGIRQSQNLETELNTQLPVFMERLDEVAQEPLTPYEKAVAALIRSGYNTKDIAALLDKSIRAIDNARYRVRQKLGLSRGDALQSFLEGIRNQ